MAKKISQITMDFGFSDPEPDEQLTPSPARPDSGTVEPQEVPVEDARPQDSFPEEDPSGHTPETSTEPFVTAHVAVEEPVVVVEVPAEPIHIDEVAVEQIPIEAPELNSSLVFIENTTEDDQADEPISPHTIEQPDSTEPGSFGTVITRAPSGRGRRSLKERAATPGDLAIPDDEQLFSRQYYSMGDVATMFREKQSLIRYWETEFDILQPKKNGKGDRFFRPVDVKNLVLIYDLLRRRKFTIEGAREYLRNNKKADQKFEMIRSLEKIKSFLLELKASL